MHGQGNYKTVTERRPRDSQLFCYICSKPGHVAKYCRAPKIESKRSSYKTENKGSSHRTGNKGDTDSKQQKPPGARKIQSNSNSKDAPGATTLSNDVNLLGCLYSSSDSDGEVKAIRVQDEASKPRCARVLVQRVPAYGIIDTAADNTIMGGNLFVK